MAMRSSSTSAPELAVVATGAGRGRGHEQVVDAAAERLGGPVGLVEGDVEHLEAAAEAWARVHSGERCGSVTVSWRATERPVSTAPRAELGELGRGGARCRPPSRPRGRRCRVPRRQPWARVSVVEPHSDPPPAGSEAIVTSSSIGTLAGHVDELLGQADAALAVGDGVVHLLDQRGPAVGEAVDDHELPQRAGAVEGVLHEQAWPGRAAGAAIPAWAGRGGAGGGRCRSRARRATPAGPGGRARARPAGAGGGCGRRPRASAGGTGPGRASGRAA